MTTPSAGTCDPNGPIAALRHIGIPASWIGREILATHRGAPMWLYAPKNLSSMAVADLAHLVVDGWVVTVRPGGNNILHIRIRRRGAAS